MIALFLLLMIVAIVLGIVGVVAKGLLYLLIIGVVVFLGALVLGALRMRRRPGRRPAREFPGHPLMQAFAGRAEGARHPRRGEVMAIPRGHRQHPGTAAVGTQSPGTPCGAGEFTRSRGAWQPAVPIWSGAASPHTGPGLSSLPWTPRDLVNSPAPH